MAQYLKPDSELGYIEDQAEIENLKFNNLRHVILGCMLGDFDEKGTYVVDPQIVKELIEMPKYIVETMDNIEICRSVLRLDKQVTFAVTFEGNKATLTLLEKLSYEANFKINSGTYSNINEYVLDFVETSGEINRNAIYTLWNIEPVGGNVIDIFNCDDSVLEKYFGIVNRFKYLLHTNKVLIDKEEEIEEIEAGYTNEIYDILKRYPKLETEVKKQVAETLNEKKDALSIKKPNFAKTFNEILDNAIQSNLNVLDEKEKQEFEIEKRNVVVNLNVKRASVVEMETATLQNEENPELSSKVIRLEHGENVKSKSVETLGEEFVSSHKIVEEKKKNETLSDQATTEKDKMISRLIKDGLSDKIGVETKKNSVGNLVAETAEKVADKKDPAKAKTTGGKTAGKSGGKSTGKGKSAGGKGKGGKKTSNKSKSGKSSKDSKEQEDKKDEQKKYGMVSQAERRRKKRRQEQNNASATSDSSSNQRDKTKTTENVERVDVGLMSIMRKSQQDAQETVKDVERVKKNLSAVTPAETNVVENGQQVKRVVTKKTEIVVGAVVDAPVTVE